MALEKELSFAWNSWSSTIPYSTSGFSRLWHSREIDYHENNERSICDLRFGRRGCCASESASECPVRAGANQARNGKTWHQNPYCASSHSSANQRVSTMSRNRRYRVGFLDHNRTIPIYLGHKLWIRNGPLRQMRRRKRTLFRDNLLKKTKEKQTHEIINVLMNNSSFLVCTAEC